MYRGNAARSRSTLQEAPATLSQRWVYEVPPLPAASLTEDWTARLAPALTQPVILGETVVCVVQDQGRVFALDAASGKRKWEYILPSRVDSAPSLSNGLVLSGCHDRWLYAIHIDTGELAWRTRIAPLEQYMVANGRVESSWPVLGSPLITNGQLFAVAGRSTEADGGLAIVQLHPESGECIWAAGSGPGAKRRADLLYSEGGKVYATQTHIDPTRKQVLRDAEATSGRPIAGSAILDAYLGVHGIRGFTKDLDAWTDGLHVRANQATLTATTSRAHVISQPPKATALQPVIWRVSFERGDVINGLFITPDHVLVSTRRSDSAGRITVLNRSKGREVT
ncbi:MAG: hypothetical protein ACI97B_001576 [Verrucomicrobiales bacterium]|jgi:hypothetical protein